MPRQVWYYTRDELCQAWVNDALKHGSEAVVCLKLGMTQVAFSHIKYGRAGLHPHLLARLDLYPVRQPHDGTIVGYMSDKPVNFSIQWQEKPTVDA